MQVSSYSQFDVVHVCGTGRRVALNVVELAVADGQLVVLSRIEVVELVDSIEDVTNKLLEEDARCDPDLAAERTSHSRGERRDVVVIDEVTDAVRSFAAACIEVADGGSDLMQQLLREAG